MKKSFQSLEYNNLYTGKAMYREGADVLNMTTKGLHNSRSIACLLYILVE